MNISNSGEAGFAKGLPSGSPSAPWAVLDALKARRASRYFWLKFWTFEETEGIYDFLPIIDLLWHGYLMHLTLSKGREIKSSDIAKLNWPENMIFECWIFHSILEWWMIDKQSSWFLEKFHYVLWKILNLDKRAPQSENAILISSSLF